MQNFKPKAITLALATAGLLTFNTQAAEQTQDEDSTEVIKVQGFRASLIKAQAVKQDSSAIVEAITAEDIGKLPDPSIAETITRLPGIAARRVDGRSAEISIRGLNEDFSTTTFNGREQVSLNDNRGVDFSLYPAEIMSGVTVYKSSDATLMTQGLAGVVDLQTVKPLAHGEQTVQLGATFEKNTLGSLNPDGEDTGKRFNLSYIDQFANDTIGVALSVNHMTSPTQQKKWLAWGDDNWPTRNYEGEDVYILGGANPRVRSTLQTRDTIMGVVELKPSDNLHIVADALIIDFEDEQIQRGIETPAAWSGANMEIYDTANGVVSHGKIGNTRSVLHGDYQSEDSKLYALGVNTQYQVNDSLTLEFDAATSKVTRDKWQLETYAGSGRGDGVGAVENIEFWMRDGNQGVVFKSDQDYSDTDVYKIGAALSWGSGNPLYEASDDQDGFLSIIEIEDELTTLKLAAEQSFQQGFISKINYGINYSDRKKSKLDTGRYLTLKAYPEMLDIPDELILAPTSLEFLGMGNMLSYDSKALYDQGYFDEAVSDETELFRASNSWTIEEQVLTTFVQANFEHEMSSQAIFSGSVGAQYIRTEQAGLSYVGSLIPNPTASFPAQVVKRSPITDEHDYANFLPSVNLNLNLFDDVYLRFSVAKTISRARMDRLSPSFSINYNEAVTDDGQDYSLDWTPWSANAGTAKLEPYEALNYDLSYEYYFADDGYISVANFHKDIQNWQEPVPRQIDFTQYAEFAPVPADQIEYFQGYVWEWGKVNGGNIDGLEITLALPGHIFADALDGFGVIASATYLDASLNIEGRGELRMPGLSDSVYTFTTYYENHGWQIRASLRKRDEYPDSLGYNNAAKTVMGETLVDAQIGYSFEHSNIQALQGLTLMLQGYNLTDQPYQAYVANNQALVSDYQEYGRSLLLSASYKF
ncbi:TonB-dependent receptor [Catenovulum sp. SX2]|uniref:TonB-dependent receptor n=1 Tax=Catenovulum sp. SX2 TaxID=3398614 RepID=UPI003F82F188